MKQIIKKTWIFIAVLCASISTYAYDFEVDGIYYNMVSLQDLTCEVTSGDRMYTGEIIIPSAVKYNNKTISVVSIGNMAFYRCREMTSVIIPNSVVTIGKMAFYECGTLPTYYDGPSLTKVTIGENVISIGASAFESCTQLVEIDIPNSVTTIGEAAFKRCYKLKRVSLSESLECIENNTFNECGLESITIPNSVSSIGDDAFSYCHELNNASIGESVTNIGTDAFRNCERLKYVTIGESVTSIGERAFTGCKLLENVIIPNSVTSIGENTFHGCESLTSMIIPNSVTSIGKEAFAYCELLECIELSNQLVKLNRGLFNGCRSLKSIAIPGSVTDAVWSASEVGSSAIIFMFGDCNSLRDMRFEYGDSPLRVDNLFLGGKYDYSSYYWPGLEIENLYIDRNLIFGAETENTLKYIKHLTLGSHVTDCSYYLANYSKNLEVITIYSLIPPKVGGNQAFSNTQYMNCIVKVPQQALEAYRQDDIWKNFWNIEGFEYSGIDAEMISLNIQEAELNIRETVQLEATVLPEDTTDKTLEWKSSNEEVAIVEDSGLVTAIGKGSATITVSCGKASAQCEITVLEEDAVEELFVNPVGTITIYSIDGILIKKECNIEELQTLDKGIYIIVTGKNRYKVSI
ncbi:MAG: leucine-rich repeat protein [Muribaculaceae bacterium]|nr:leucine-rich repeat protein [Muribaculaceae bacterium]